jgi:hypothetical protein
MFWLAAFAALFFVALVSFLAGIWIGRAGLTSEEIAAARRARVATKAAGVLPHAEDI